MRSYESLPSQELEKDIHDEEEYDEYLNCEDLFSAGYENDFNHELEDGFVEDTNSDEDHLEPVAPCDPCCLAEYYSNHPVRPIDDIDFEAVVKEVRDEITRDPMLMEPIMSIINEAKGVARREISNNESISGASERNSHHIDNGQDINIGYPEAQRKKNCASYCSGKVDLEKIFVITNFVLELPSAIFDQLSSVHKPQ